MSVESATIILYWFEVIAVPTKKLYTFPVPDHYDSPTLILSREDGAGVIDASKEKKEATIVLNSKIEKSEAYQLIGYLPGKDYGTDKDEQIILTNHTDGPSITQDNGALGILGIIKYFSNIPQENKDFFAANYERIMDYGLETMAPNRQIHGKRGSFSGNTAFYGSMDDWYMFGDGFMETRRVMDDYFSSMDRPDATPPPEMDEPVESEETSRKLQDKADFLNDFFDRFYK